MRILVLGGSGHVGALTVPRLAAAPYGHTITVFDRRPPAYEPPPGAAPLEYREGDVTDGRALEAVMPGYDAVLYLAMGPWHHGDRYATTADAFDVNVKATWLAADAAARGGVGRFVYASSLSIYEDTFGPGLTDEDRAVPDALNTYGITKQFGEECVHRIVMQKRGNLSAFALRLCFPVETAAEVAEKAAEGKDCGLTAEETTRAFHTALTAPPPPGDGYAAVFIVGARAAGRVNLARAKRLLGWEPDPLVGSSALTPGPSPN